jgi:signal recognition particle GTPase
MSARLAGIETYLVTDCMIGDAAPSGADNVSDSLGFESWILANYWV